MDGAIVKVKDPLEYLTRLEFHKILKTLRIISFNEVKDLYRWCLLGNPGKGWAAIILDVMLINLNFGNEKHTTNNRMS